MEDYKVNKRDLNYKRRGRPKMDFWVSKQGLREEEEKEEEEEEERSNQAKVWMLDFGMDSSSELYDFCTQTT